MPAALRKLLPLALIVAGVWLLSAVAGHWRGAQQAERLRELAGPGDIVMLSSRSCIFCDRARSWLDAQRVPYSECFIESNAACAEAYRAQMAPGTPTFVLRGRSRVVGFDRERIVSGLERR